MRKKDLLNRIYSLEDSLERISAELSRIKNDFYNYRSKTYLDECKIKFIFKEMKKCYLRPLPQSLYDDINNHWAPIIDGKRKPEAFSEVAWDMIYKRMSNITDCNNLEI